MDQVKVAHLLGIKLLSSRFHLTVEPKGAQTLPERWQVGFEIIQDGLRGQLQNEDEVDAGAKGVPSQNLKLSHWQTLRTVIYDSGTPVQANQVRAAALKDGTIAVSCTPYEFAEELCRVLFNQWGLRLRRDLVDLLPTVAIQLTKLDDATFIPTWYSKNTLVGTDQSQSSTEAQKPCVPVTPTRVEVSKESNQPSNTPEGVPGPDEPTADQTIPEEEKLDEVAPGGSYTQDIREARVRALIELERKIRDALTTDVSPVEKPENEKIRAGEFRTDDPYRQAALKYERDNNRYASAKSATQAGHDIDSYTHPQEHPDRRLIRRIEVKGRSTRWDSNEIVEMSDIQFKDALNMTPPEDERIDSTFDYWLYVVERDENGELKVLPIRNVAKRAARFGLKGGSWRHEVEPELSRPAVSHGQQRENDFQPNDSGLDQNSTPD